MPLFFLEADEQLKTFRMSCVTDNSLQYLFHFRMGVVQFKMGIALFKMGIVLFKMGIVHFKMGIVQFKMEKLL